MLQIEPGNACYNKREKIFCQAYVISQVTIITYEAAWCRNPCPGVDLGQGGKYGIGQ